MADIYTADKVREQLKDALDGIEMMSIGERSKLLGWADNMRDLGMWAVPGMEVMVGVHNKCVLENRIENPDWDDADFYVID